MNVRLTKEQKVRVRNSTDVYAIMQQVLLRENRIRRVQEHFWIIGLTDSNRISFIELLSLGGLNRVNIAPPEVFRMAIYKVAPKVIFVHNHPSGTLDPSENDLDITNLLLKAGRIINIEVVDHFIISETNYFSMLEEGHIEQMNRNKDYTIIKDFEAKLNQIKESSQSQMKNEMVRGMLQKNIDPQIIAEISGLTLAVIQKMAKGVKV